MRRQARYRKTRLACHSEPFAVILSAAKDLALPAQGKLREESSPDQIGISRARFLASLGMTTFARVFVA
jgi:hypothetical protein